MKQQTLEKRYQFLWKGELLSVFLFLVLFLYHSISEGQWRNWIIRFFSLSVVIIILLQGSVWWKLKLKLLRARNRVIPNDVLKRYRLFKKVNWVLLGLFPFVVLFSWWNRNYLLHTGDLLFGTLFLFGAKLEQINYYYYQLMYDNRYDWNYLRKHRRLRQGSIGKAISRL